jgi:hypothetical protein
MLFIAVGCTLMIHQVQNVHAQSSEPYIIPRVNKPIKFDGKVDDPPGVKSSRFFSLHTGLLSVTLLI